MKKKGEGKFSLYGLIFQNVNFHLILQSSVLQLILCTSSSKYSNPPELCLNKSNINWSNVHPYTYMVQVGEHVWQCDIRCDSTGRL